MGWLPLYSRGAMEFSQGSRLVDRDSLLVDRIRTLVEGSTWLEELLVARVSLLLVDRYRMIL